MQSPDRVETPKTVHKFPDLQAGGKPMPISESDGARKAPKLTCSLMYTAIDVFLALPELSYTRNLLRPVSRYAYRTSKNEEGFSSQTRERHIHCQDQNEVLFGLSHLSYLYGLRSKR
jgi:hypothetical protein